MSQAPVPFLPRQSRSLGLGLVGVFLCWLAASTTLDHVREQRRTWPLIEQASWLPSPKTARIASIGYTEVLADYFWIRGLQYYGQRRAGLGASSDFEYLHLYVDTIIALDPNFRAVYEWAADHTHLQGKPTLDEYKRKAHYLRLGKQQFPDDYQFTRRLGITYYELIPQFFRKDDPEYRRYKELGMDLVEESIHKKGAPPDAATLAASLFTQQGRLQRAQDTLREMVLTTANAKARQKIFERLVQAQHGSAGPTDAELELLKRVARRQTRQWQRDLPYVRRSLYDLLGPAMSKAIDFDRLATERDIIGIYELPTEEEEDEAREYDDSSEVAPDS